MLGMTATRALAPDDASGRRCPAAQSSESCTTVPATVPPTPVLPQLRWGTGVVEMDSSMSVDEDLGGVALPPPISAPAVGDAKMGGGRGSTIDTDLLEIPVEEFGEKVKIGRGSFGEVFRCQWRATSVAVKILSDQSMSDEALKEFRTEVTMMSKMRHPNVVLLMGICSSAPNLAIVTEYLARGSLYRLLHHTETPLDERRRVKMAIDIAKGMAYLHSADPPIVHRDLKSPNLLVDETFTVKICDFGLARFKQDTFVATVNGCAGTPNYMAPEVLRNEKFNEKCDVFSMGVVLWELISRKEPYAKMAPLQVIAAVVFQGQRLPQPTGCDPRLCDLIDRCWAPESETRPSFFAVQEILQGIFEDLVRGHAAGQRRTVIGSGS